eukprot:m.29395 g.29395  ORF g.29395 m.29395 type:complete len:772 (+) comp9160_c1_seq1:108-2423(+)
MSQYASRQWIARVGVTGTRRLLSSYKPVASATSQYREQRAGADLGSIAETRQHAAFLGALQSGDINALPQSSPLAPSGLNAEDAMIAIQAGFATHLCHMESRIAYTFGESFYTIGPGGEENLGVIGLALRPTDMMCLHYRHLATQIARQLRTRPIEDILLARARAHTVSKQDEVTGGVHCALGGEPNSFVSTSTLSSQCPPAVGRALGLGLSHFLQCSTRDKRAISYVSLGDGSVNNAHFLTALNFAEYAKHRGFKCPVLFAVTDNNLCISLKGYDWFQKGFLNKVTLKTFVADSTNPADIWTTSNAAIKHCRSRAEPILLALKDTPRRYGHAATDRQGAYLTTDEIQQLENVNPLAGFCRSAVEAGYTTMDELAALMSSMEEKTIAAFETAVTESKVDTDSLMSRLQRSELPPMYAPSTTKSAASQEGTSPAPAVMRKSMNKILQEILENHSNVVYIGEDVEHGGYYLVSERLKDKFPHRVRDFPPDETMLIGAGLGFSQVGICPIVELPYAKYLDCGADMFFETALMSWLNNRDSSKGMIFRLQGFGNGVFGGNFHTHNTLHLPPGIDVVCYSNGEDYARGWRYAIRAAQEGRLVMSVDSTNLLNKRHLAGQDGAWKKRFPKPTGDEEQDELAFHSIVEYQQEDVDDSRSRTLIVSYGEGVADSLNAATKLAKDHDIHATVVDHPLLSEVSTGLRDLLQRREFDQVVFADVCKIGQHPFGHMVCQLQAEGLLPQKWQCVGAMPTYNPLGSTITFLNSAKIETAVLDLTS